MVGGTNLMCDPILMKQSPKIEMDEMQTSITNDSPGTPKSRENVLMNNFHDNFVIIHPSDYGFYPFRHVIHRHQNVLMTKRW